MVAGSKSSAWVSFFRSTTRGWGRTSDAVCSGVSRERLAGRDLAIVAIAAAPSTRNATSQRRAICGVTARLFDGYGAQKGHFKAEPADRTPVGRLSAHSSINAG